MNTKIAASILWLALLCVCGPVVAAQDERSVTTTQFIPAPPARVLQAFVKDKDLSAWWQVSRSLVEPAVGGIWSISWDDWDEEKTQHAWSGVIDVISDRKLVISRMVMNEPNLPLLGPMQLEIEAKAVDGGSSVTVTHRGYGYGGHWDKIYADVVNGWDQVLGDMQEWLRDEY